MKEENANMIKSKLGKASIGIAGLGGLGSNVAMALARAGVGRLVIVDFDEVEASNLNRQAYTLDQVGMRKTEALTQNIAKANTDVDVTAIHLKLEPGFMDAPFASVDIIIEALDNASTKATFIEEISLKFPDKPIIVASGVAGIRGTERIQMKRSGNLYLVYDDTAPSCDETAVLAPRVGLFAYWQASLALEILLGCENGD
ncbi:MAG: sulfur carrier protein ThiS adenylyltransferase ThiF [Candidatus Thermoplasmatota archaeon]|nr:sulfur carrier protein ThiS adenylyltransferase ThiF [Euryarchaeota archaeon]MBU4031707.1 sulfur carrier protein ThiS adenylyltransferase ThiF [Candidatus Thermoplasmatota archaeon]MBU4070944.1 sulfur carrier protein ThiS adenylyltransferase ThiF [Candidatus Thermoplasmatota archaeon]MBU4143997.1 sulfur carrier protein ThiS adenylyltransferase ThiF [Candidatus Thermoplasmatota archaeon]MBU4591889.1 sulfur carrier protein ThiS adenylyltransferase ThiF [Candidatus Thermoplasmatota archaeon]